MTEHAKDDRTGRCIRADGKASFDNIYDAPTPADYFSALKPLQYEVPGHAQPMVRRCVGALQRLRGRRTVKVLDLCAGYCINGALLKHRASLEDLYSRFGTAYARAAGAMRIPGDVAWFLHRRRADAAVHVVAQDVAHKALDYAQAVGLADEVIAADFEARVPTPEEAARIAGTDLIVVTGGLSYIGARTLNRAMQAAGSAPWTLYFPLRHADTEAVDEMFEEAGYEVETARRPISQRRYESPEERRSIRERILAEAEPGEPVPSTNHIEALVKLARPRADLVHPPFEEIVGTGGPPWPALGRIPAQSGSGGNV